MAFIASMPVTSKSAAGPLVYIKAPADGVFLVLRAEISQSNSETSKQLRAHLHRATDDATGGTAVTPAPLGGTGAATGTFVHSPTGGATAGDIVGRLGFNLLNGYVWIPTPLEQILVGPSKRLVLRLDTAPTTIDVIASIVFEQLGPTN